MKKLTWYIVFFVWSAGIASANDSAYHNAGVLYQGGEYEAALETYREIILSGYEAPDLYYNMGNAAFRSNSIGYAILYYEKALKLDPSHEDAAHNLEYVSRYCVDVFDEVPQFFIRSWVSAWVHLFPEQTWSILALVSFLIILTSLLFYLFSRGLALKKTGFFVLLTGLILFGLTLSASLSQHHSVIHPEHGVVLAPSTVVRSTPSDTGTELFILHEGTRIRANEEVTGWFNIRVADGREGWVRAADFERI